MFGKYDEQGKLVSPPNELVRLAIPRRTYTQSHVDYLAEVIAEVHRNRESIRGVAFTYEAQFLRHFTARFKQL
jgi:tryptophanase